MRRDLLVNFNNISKIKCRIPKYLSYCIEGDLIIPTKESSEIAVDLSVYFHATSERIYTELINVDSTNNDSILEFCNKYGLFYNRQKLKLNEFMKQLNKIKSIIELYIELSNFNDETTYSVWSENTKNLRKAISSLNVSCVGGPLAQLKKDVMIFLDFDYSDIQCYVHKRTGEEDTDAQLKKYIETKKLIYLAKTILCRLISHYANYLNFYLSVNSATNEIIQVLKEETLESAMYVQLYLDIATERKIHRCNCGKIFMTAPKSHHKKYCSSVCAHRAAQKTYATEHKEEIKKKRKQKNTVTSSSKKISK